MIHQNSPKKIPELSGTLLDHFLSLIPQIEHYVYVDGLSYYNLNAGRGNSLTRLLNITDKFDKIYFKEFVLWHFSLKPVHFGSKEEPYYDKESIYPESYSFETLSTKEKDIYLQLTK
jgi:hypothetical protein